MTDRPLEVPFAAPPGEWVLRAACRSVDPEVMYPDTHQRVDVAAAKAVCAGCPVRAECLEYVMSTEPLELRHGVWAGRTPLERRRMVQAPPDRRQPIVHGTDRGAKAHYRRGETPCRPCLDASAIATAERKRRRSAS